MKDALKGLGWWFLRNVILRVPSVRLALTDIVISIDSGLSPAEVLARAVTQALPGERDSQIAAELADIPAREWLRTRGARLMLPTGRSLFQEWVALRESIRGD